MHISVVVIPVGSPDDGGLKAIADRLHVAQVAAGQDGKNGPVPK